MLRKIIDKLRQGFLRELLAETRWIYSYAARFRNGILLYILLGLFSTALGLGSSVVSKYLIDAVTGHQDTRLLQIGVLYVGLGLARPIVTAVTRWINATISIRATTELQSEVFQQFMAVDWQASLDYHSGDLLSRIHSDVSTVASSILGWIPSLIISAVQLSATFVVLLVYDPTLAAIALLSTPVTVFLTQSVLMKMREFNQDVRKLQADLLSFFEESLQNLQAIKSFHLNLKFSSRLDALQGIYRNVSLNSNLFSAKNSLLLSCVGFIVSCLCFIWGVYRLWSGHISFGTMVLFIQMAGLLSSTFTSLLSLLPSAVSATVAAQRIMTILSLPQEDLSIHEDAKMVMDSAANHGIHVRIENVQFHYQNGHKVFEDLSLYAAPGEIIGLVGTSGSGKTSLIRMLLGLVSPERGRILLESGGNQALLSPCMRSLITYVAQEKVVFSGSIAECLRMSNPLASDSELEQALKQACALEFVETLPGKLNFQLQEHGRGLSEGQIQRLAIARALLSPAPVMLLDEATSALDLETERTVLHNLLTEGRRRTVIATTHRPTVLLSCTRVYAIQNGRAVLLDRAEINKLTYG